MKCKFLLTGRKGVFSRSKFRRWVLTFVNQLDYFYQCSLRDFYIMTCVWVIMSSFGMTSCLCISYLHKAEKFNCTTNICSCIWLNVSKCKNQNFIPEYMTRIHTYFILESAVFHMVLWCERVVAEVYTIWTWTWLERFTTIL